MLCRRVAERDEAAFDLLVARYQGRAYRLAWSMVRDAEDARDLSQEAFLRVYRTAGSFRGDARFSTWFYRVLVNLCLDHRRRGWWQRLVVRDAIGEDPERGVLERQAAPVVDPGDTLGREQLMTRAVGGGGSALPAATGGAAAARAGGTADQRDRRRAAVLGGDGAGSPAPGGECAAQDDGSGLTMHVDDRRRRISERRAGARRAGAGRRAPRGVRGLPPRRRREPRRARRAGPGPAGAAARGLGALPGRAAGEGGAAPAWVVDAAVAGAGGRRGGDHRPGAHASDSRPAPHAISPRSTRRCSARSCRCCSNTAWSSASICWRTST